MDVAAHEAALDGLAGSLRERMLAQPPELGADDDARTRIRALVDREAGMLDEPAREALAERIAERSFGLGPLEPLLADPAVDEILVCGTAPAWVERGGRLEQTTARFPTEAELRHAIERILAPLGRRVDEAEPLCDARLPDRRRGPYQSCRLPFVVIHRGRSLPSLGDLERPIDGYIRVSRVGDRSGESYISPDVQRHAIEAWAAERGVELVVHEPEENVSGGTMDRPIFNLVMARIRNGESGGVVVYKLDRFARTLVGGLATLTELTDQRALFASATEPLFDFTTADGRIFLQINLMMAEYFRERAKESWEASLVHAVGRGVHIAPDVPYGYLKDAGKRLVPSPAAPFVLRAYEHRVDGWAYQRIADWLNDVAPARADGRPWTASTAERMLHRRVYLGVAHWGEHENRDAHEPLVEEQLWHTAQRRVQHASKRRQSPEIALLHGLCRCAGCRFQMSRALNRSGGYLRHYYRCRVHRVSGTCQAPAAVRADGEDAIEAYVERLVGRELERRAATYVEVSDSAALGEAYAQLEQAREDLEQMRQDAGSRRRLGALWLSFVEPLVEAVQLAEQRVEQLRASHHAPSLSGLTADAYRSLDREERASVLCAVIDCVFVRNVGGPRGPQAVPIDERRVRILWRGQGPRDLPARNKVSPVIPWGGFENELTTGMASR
jgi:DNA invertase Pin-like site-specific DNA recombinase